MNPLRCVGSGDVTLMIVNMAAVGTQVLVGYSAGGASVDLGARDLSTAFATGQTIADVQTTPLALTATSVPAIGTSSYTLKLSNVPNLVPLGFLFFGDTSLPGIGLGSIGMPGCQAYSNANLGSVSIPVTLPAGTGSVPFPIPNIPALAGIALVLAALAASRPVVAAVRRDRAAA